MFAHVTSLKKGTVGTRLIIVQVLPSVVAMTLPSKSDARQSVEPGRQKTQSIPPEGSVGTVCVVQSTPPLVVAVMKSLPELLGPVEPTAQQSEAEEQEIP